MADACSVPCPYTVGNILQLHPEEPHEEQVIEARITKVFEPFTLSCVVAVSIESQVPTLTGEFALKLFDRRFVTEVRKEQDISPWTPHLEQQYHQFILDGGASKLIDDINDDVIDPAEDGDSWNDVQTEAYAHNHLNAFYQTEVRVYNALKDIQGRFVPQVFACVTLPSSATRPEPVSEYTDVPGILMEYIEGFSLSELGARAPKEAWQTVGDTAIYIVNNIMDRGILNKDVKERNFVVDPENNFQVRMIDFALCDFREEYEDEAAWKRAQAIEDEEGGIGVCLHGKLKGGYTWVQSPRVLELSRFLHGEEISIEPAVTACTQAFFKESEPPKLVCTHAITV